MSKVYKSKDKFVVYLPFEVLTSLEIEERDEVDFFKFSGKSFLFAKKNDIVELLKNLESQQSKPAPPTYQAAEREKPEIDDKELALLKKLDTLRYPDRTKEKVGAILNPEEKQILQKLLKNKFVVLFKKPNEQNLKYSIAKNIYDKFLFVKRDKKPETKTNPIKTEPVIKEPIIVKKKEWEQKLDTGNNYVQMLESRGYLVLMNEAEAANASAALEESIRQGLILGTRAFNKKFYIALRGYINKNAPKLLKTIEEKSMNVSDIAKETGVEEEGVRAVLYILSDSGDVTEIKRDVFKAA